MKTIGARHILSRCILVVENGDCIATAKEVHALANLSDEKFFLEGFQFFCKIFGEKNFPLIQRYVDAVETASEEAIVAAMRRIWEVLKIIIEPSCAVPYAAILEGKIPVAGLRVGLILTGGNVDLDALPWLKK